jgi:hypothetical protein
MLCLPSWTKSTFRVRGGPQLRPFGWQTGGNVRICSPACPEKPFKYKHGRVAEWFKAPVLKTGRGFRSLVGSNPTPSARNLI